ncbi:uncharacterized protein LOC144567116 [Carex rostrata]
MVDRFGGARNFTVMDRFNEVLDDLQVLEIPLKNRLYTWSNKQPGPSFSKLDRAFLSTHWSSQFPSLTLEALELSASDHFPLVLTCKQLQTTPKPYRLERAWFNYPKLAEVVLSNWSGDELAEASFQHKRLDVREFSIRLKLKERIFELANFEELKWFQRSRCRWLQHGDRNTTFFHNFASSRTRLNMVSALQVGQQVIKEDTQIRQIFLHHMKVLLGAADPVLDFDVPTLYQDTHNLEHLAAPFTEIEIEHLTRLAAPMAYRMNLSRNFGLC